MAALWALAVVVASGGTARAADDGFVLSPGVMVARRLDDGGWRFDGELSVTYYLPFFGLGVATGGSSTRYYFELQPVVVIGAAPPRGDRSTSVFLGFNPGVVIAPPRLTSPASVDVVASSTVKAGGSIL